MNNPTIKNLQGHYFTNGKTPINIKKIILILTAYGVSCPEYHEHSEYHDYRYSVILNRSGKLRLFFTNDLRTERYTKLLLKDFEKL